MADKTAEQRYAAVIIETRREVEKHYGPRGYHRAVTPEEQSAESSIKGRLMIAAMEAHAAAAVAKERERCAQVARCGGVRSELHPIEESTARRIAKAIERGADSRTEGNDHRS